MAVIGLVWLFATATLTYAAGQKLTTTPAKAPAAVAAPRPTLVVPDIRGQAFVFAKGILADGGFGWRVNGSVQGYATNVVASQRPAPGTRVEDTGAPTLTLTMQRGTYPQDGTPENASPYAGTAIVLTKTPRAAAKKLSPRTVPTARAKAAAKSAAKRVHAAAKPKRKVRKVHVARARPPAFIASGAPREPLNEIPLTVRGVADLEVDSDAECLAVVRQYLSFFPSSHGAEAPVVESSDPVDRRVESQWGIGHDSEFVARRALAAVEAQAK